LGAEGTTAQSEMYFPCTKSRGHNNANRTVFEACGGLIAIKGRMKYLNKAKLTVLDGVLRKKSDSTEGKEIVNC